MAQDQQTDASLNAIFSEGLSHHQAGRLDMARKCYEQVLAIAPRHFDSLHMLGVFAIQTGQLEPAVELIGQAISIRDDDPRAFGNLGNALNGLGRHAQALEVSDRGIALAPEFVQVHGNRGHALQKLGRLEEAAASYLQALTLGPTAQAHLNLSVVLRDLGRFESALETCGSAIALNPNSADAFRSRGIILSDLDRLDEALASLDRAVALKPDLAQAWSDRGLVLRRLGRAADALASQDEAVRLQPSNVEAMCGRVAPLRELNRPEEALAAAEQAVAARPDYAQAHNVRGVVLQDLRRLDEALGSYDRAVALDPGHAKALTNRGIVLYESRRLSEAMESYDLAIARQPNFAEAQNSQAMCRLMLGDLAAGWAQYEWRWQIDELRPERRGDEAPTWLGGESLAGKTILLWAEQGLGDTLQFCRFAPAVAALGAEVILEVQPGLERLMAGLSSPVRVATRGQPSPSHDFQTPLMSLPHALGAGPAGEHAPYLRGDAEERAAWARRLDGGSTGLHVGLCWAGGLRPHEFGANTVDQRRSLALAAFAPLATVAGLQVYSLQKGGPAAQLADLQADGWGGPEIIDLTADLKDFADTAALVANLDLVITCDTAVAHLAGALGKPVWILNRFDACWRWLTDREDSPWYPTARLFRQPAPGDWTSVIENVVRELAVFARKTS
jgi:tetratricopeptide (TPR) repeat protein